MSELFVCPHCGADVPRTATACPECGSDDQTGWSDEAEYVHLLSYDEGETAVPHNPFSWSRLAMTAVAIIVVVSLLLATTAQLGWSPLLVMFLILGGGAYYFWRAPRKEAAPDQNLYDDLMRKAGGDRALVDRWLAYEEGHNPEGDLQEWMADAKMRWERDNR